EACAWRKKPVDHHREEQEKTDALHGFNEAHARNFPQCRRNNDHARHGRVARLRIDAQNGDEQDDRRRHLHPRIEAVQDPTPADIPSRAPPPTATRAFGWHVSCRPFAHRFPSFLPGLSRLARTRSARLAAASWTSKRG